MGEISEDSLDNEEVPGPTFEANEVIKLKHSFGYDCKRLFNMVLIDEDTLVFASGTYIHYFSISRREVTFRETVFGCGVGFITKNYNSNYQGLLTIGENGPKATVFIYKHPSIEPRIKLEGAAKQQFTCGSYNSSGELFASQAGYPDFMLTIWRWEKTEVVLRSKAFQNDVLHVHFSRFNPILLVSCGLSHIKFWKMANTFTGLKLQGDLGRFGKTDFSDIYAVCMLADETVISGCEWGNMLLWEAGLIKFEICRKGRRACHSKPIVRITMENGEVTTVSMDGYVRIWFWETVDLADPPDDDRFVEIEPIFEFYVGDCEIRMMQKIKLFDPNDFGHYVLDGGGGVWYCDLNTKDIPNDSYKLYSCHGGRVIAAQTSPISTHLMTLGQDGRILVYDYEREKLILEKLYTAVGTDLLWFGPKVSDSCMELVASFEDGVIRQIFLDLSQPLQPNIHLIRPIKAHTAAVTRITINPSNSLLITGSADRSIFLYSLTEKKDAFVFLQPMGFIQFNAIPNCFYWKDEEPLLLIGCQSGEIYEYQLPMEVSEEQTTLSYNLTDKKVMKVTKFISVKSLIRRELRREEIKRRKEKKKQQKLEDIERLKASNPGLQIDMESALADSEPEEEEEPLHIPPTPNPVLWLRQTINNTIWVSMGGYDAGYIYELAMETENPVHSTIIKDADDIEIHSFLDFEEYLVFGMGNGGIRIQRKNPSDFTDLRNYGLLCMHNPLNGTIPSLILSHDGSFIISIGFDGNVFVYNWFGPIIEIEKRTLPVITPKITPTEDIFDAAHPSLEQEKIYAEIKRQEMAAAAHDRKVLEDISALQLKFNDLLEQNMNVEEDLRIGHRDLLMDERITKQIQDELQSELDDVREDLAYDLEVAQVGKKKLYDYFIKKLDHIPIKISNVGCSTHDVLYSFRLERLDDNFEAIKADIEERLRLEALKRIPVHMTMAEEKDDAMPEPPSETFFFGRDPNSIIPRFSRKMLRLLTRYRSRQLFQVERLYNWEKMFKQKPDPNRNHPDDDRKIQEAEKSIGDYKLKTGLQYQPQPHETLAYKYKEIVSLRETLHALIDNFNKRVFLLRDSKKELYNMIEKKRKRLEEIHRYLPEKNRKYLMEIRPLNVDEEWPELNLIEHCHPGCNINVKDILYLEQRVEDMVPKQEAMKIKSFASQDGLHESEIYAALQVKELECFPNGPTLLTELQNLPQPGDLGYFNMPENKDSSSTLTSSWLIELRYRWLLDLLVEQDGIIHTIHQNIKTFDNRLHELEDIRLQTKFEAEFMQSYLIVLNQELYILRDSEQIENQLLTNADTAMKTRNATQTSINTLNRQIEDLRKNCDRLNEQILDIRSKFQINTKGHKFFDFLRRIFKKKWRPPKPQKSGDESSESSSADESSSEDEDDTKSIDSTDVTTIRLDESHCPAGLERHMYELAFKLRSDRHDMERALSEALRQIDIKKEEVKAAQMKKKHHENVFSEENEKLLEFRRKRQLELNKVHVAVVLHMHQLQHFREGEDYRDLSKAVLFDSTLLMNLQGRVDQLKVETLETKRLHRINIVHLRRLNTDLKFMRSEIYRLEDLIRQEMMKKFGMVIDLDELEEEVLRKYVFELETTAEDEMRLLELEMKEKRTELAIAQEELIKETQMHCDKLNILAILTEEKTFLEKLLVCQQKNYEKWAKRPGLSIDKDIEKLTLIEREQKEQIRILEREICTLRMKAKPLQIDGESGEAAASNNQETIPTDGANTCPEIFQADAYQARRLIPDEFIMDRCQKVVQKLFLQHFGKMTSRENVRRYANKVTRYLGQAAYSFEGVVTDDIMNCIIENLQTLMPKKYLVVLTRDHLEKMFNEILAVFDYERSDVNTEDVISGIFDNAREALQQTTGILNKTQFMLIHMFKELIEILPLEEFQSDDTVRFIADNLEKEPYFDGRCINIEGLVDKVVEYAKANLLDAITAIPIRNLAVRVQKECSKRRPQNALSVRCSIGSVSVSMKSKGPS
ncbi:cilia- and flagella-associated protein 44 [Stomoxys calcitrans]|uniref:cilia- and flagella-associated protein 44 n=1 Tax=Stomoxys calcitrans TaxID=35570 RepID=UPI0027E2E716|nr:cilia- and flagella-associated protein 44 [Stomoxys calcitrans]